MMGAYQFPGGLCNIANADSDGDDGSALPIRDVIAFPKTTTGRDLLFETPSTVNEPQLSEYHVQVIKQ